ncbi:MAG: hypothetical protein EON87_01145 [Brevundimonas sp.]|nr:MAG: hypothetical protein EON87_01145 [Brevundimonas sp.]
MTALIVPDTGEAKASTDLDDLFRTLKVAALRARRWLRRHEPLLTALLDTWVRFHALDRSGWLPHYTTPFHLLDPAEQDPAVARRIVGHYYEAEWPAVEAAFRRRLCDHGFDAETLATFDEALVAHRHGLYRATPRTLFPDIERRAREVLGNDGLTSSQASLRDLRRAVDSLGVDNFSRTGVLSPKLYRMFAEHLYSNVKTLKRVAELKGDPVPNRHAALHGLVVYANGQASLNALIMAEYAHLSILAVARRAADTAALAVDATSFSVSPQP